MWSFGGVEEGPGFPPPKRAAGSGCHDGVEEGSDIIAIMFS